MTMDTRRGVRPAENNDEPERFSVVSDEAGFTGRFFSDVW